MKGRNIMSVGFIEQKDNANEEDAQEQDDHDQEKQELCNKVLTNGLALSTVKYSNPLADQITNGVSGRPGVIKFQQNLKR